MEIDNNADWLDITSNGSGELIAAITSSQIYLSTNYGSSFSEASETAGGWWQLIQAVRDNIWLLRRV